MKLLIHTVLVGIIGVAWLGVFWAGDSWYANKEETKRYEEKIVNFNAKSLTQINNEKLGVVAEEDTESKEEKNEVDERSLGFASTNSADTRDKIEENSTAPLPPRIQLAVPFTSQAPEKNWDQPWQDACEEAAVLMMDAYYKKYGISPLFAKDEIIKMVEWEDKKNWEYSIPLQKIEQLFQWYDGTGELNTRIVKNPTVGELKRFLSEGKPVYVVADGKILPNPHFTNGGPEYHALVLTGYTETHFISNDPGTQHGEGFEYEYDDLLNSIADWNGNRVDHGRKVVLVVE